MAQEFDLSLTRTKLSYIRRHPKYLEMIKSAVEEKVEEGISTLKLGCAELAEDCITALRTLVKDGNIKAISEVIKVIAGNQVEEVKQAQQLTVILPSLKPKEVEVNVTPDKPKGLGSSKKI